MFFIDWSCFHQCCIKRLPSRMLNSSALCCTRKHSKDCVHTWNQCQDWCVNSPMLPIFMLKLSWIFLVGVSALMQVTVAADFLFQFLSSQTPVPAIHIESTKVAPKFASIPVWWSWMAVASFPSGSVVTARTSSPLLVCVLHSLLYISYSHGYLIGFR